MADMTYNVFGGTLSLTESIMAVSMISFALHSTAVEHSIAVDNNCSYVRHYDH